MRSCSRHSRASAALYSVFSMLMLSSFFILFTTYPASIGALTGRAQEQHHLSLLAGRISNLASLAEHYGISSETRLDRQLSLYGIRPANYTLSASAGGIALTTRNAQARINGAAAISLGADNRTVLAAPP